METLTTRGIEVSVDTEYWSPYSHPERDHYVFAYKITIDNQGLEPVRLRRRCWKVTEATGEVKMVEGPGVVGEQPVLQPGGRFAYTSWCQLSAPNGAMEGFFTMDTARGESFPAFVPKFVLVAPWKLN